MKRAEKNVPFRIFIDTGGTFTDCLAIKQAGLFDRCKVLSNSTIRGTVSGMSESLKVYVNIDYSLCDQFFKGYSFSLLSAPEKTYSIINYDEKKKAITLDSKLTPPPDNEASFEIRSPEEAPVLATRIITKTPLGMDFPPLKVRLSTTKGTNALLERDGSNSVLIVTEGFKDLLNIRNQQRPDLFSLNIKKPQPFYKHVIEVSERLDAKGNVIMPLDIEHLKTQIRALPGHVESAGICLMHSYTNPVHEHRIASILNELGMNHISISSDLSPTIKIVPRATTTDINAYLSPVMENYLIRISKTLKGNSLHVMTSAGNLSEVEKYKPKDGLLSGPAGGIIGAAAIGKRNGFSKIISFDMGGTSTDVARFDDKIDYTFEHTVGDATLSAPAVDIETIAAGGGSICDFDGRSLTVGPESAGADPGPACYGRGGPLTITDVNLLSGRLHPSNFHISIDPGAAQKKFSELVEEIHRSGNQTIKETEILNGFLDIANERMAQAIRKISIQKGFDPAEYAMVCFGGAGAQHALNVAAKLGIQDVLVPTDAGLLSAYGLYEARLEEIKSLQILKSLKKTEDNLTKLFSKLSEDAKKSLVDQGVHAGDIHISRRQLFLRFKGQDSTLEIEWDNQADITDQFKKYYVSQFGHWLDNREIEIESIRVVVTELNPEKDSHDESNMNNFPENTDTHYQSHPEAEKTSSGFQIFKRDLISPKTEISGPAIILDPFSTTVIESGWRGKLLNDGTWTIQNKSSLNKNGSAGVDQNRAEAINLQLYTNRFRSVADQMGEMLRKTSMSVNVKERLDYSCALLDRDGYLVVNAPHIPVHLGAMGTCVRTIMSTINKDLQEGDVIITNHPAFGGSHLPDVTVITPVFFNGNRIGFAASRAHHAEIGGKRPGSMPPDAVNLAEEGVVIPPLFLARAGNFDWKTITGLLKDSPLPSRSPDENIADIRSAVAANYRGVKELQGLAKTFGVDQVTGYMQKLKEYAAERMQSTLKKLPDGLYKAGEKLDDGSLLAVSCTVDRHKMKIDFSGTSGVHPGNLNANPSIVNSVIMYVLRLMIDEPLPLNDGLLEPIEIVIPEGMLNPVFSDNPKNCPAVVGGNIEVSQRLTDTFLKAFGLAACSYGTMNNVLFGNDSFGYYETVAGGTGAGDGFDGADAVHQHMTNTRAADPEILELRYPVRLNRYCIRENSGGAGKWNGGNGIIRDMMFLEPVSLSVLAQHRIVSPYGLNGGTPGKTGRHWIQFKDGREKQLNWRDGADLKAGDRFMLLTPGGGGYGNNS